MDASAFVGFLLRESFGLLDFQLLKPQPVRLSASQTQEANSVPCWAFSVFF